MIDALAEGYQTRLGKWFKGGRELSGGQWQKIALSRAFMRVNADILVLDEPTSAMDPEAEVQIFDHPLSDAEERAVLESLETRWGTPTNLKVPPPGGG